MSLDDPITFPDVPRVELDRLLTELVERAQEVRTTQGRLRALVRANSAVVEQLELPAVLRRIVEAAVDLVGAEYGALGVLSPTGGLEEFVHVGISAQDVAAIDHLPKGHGILGALIDDPRPIRLPTIADDPRSVGFPTGHPPMRSFLGVPVRVSDEVFGNLYLANSASGEFGADDEQLVTSLAATAGFAIGHARLFADSRRRQAWANASAEITATLLAEEETDSVPVLLDRVLQLSDADTACLVLATDDPASLRIVAARGESGDALAGSTIPTEGSIAARVMRSRQPLLSDNADAESEIQRRLGMGPVMAVPMGMAGRTEGTLVLARRIGRSRFTPADLDMAADFAGQVSVVLELAGGRADRQRMVLLEDRGRIARDLHDHVIQQLFASGLRLQGIAKELPPGPAADGIGQSVIELDAAIGQIRTAIFALSAPQHGAPSLRSRIIDVVNELAAGLEGTPTLTFSGPVDLVLGGELAGDVVAVTREALTNVVKHAAALRVSVGIAVDDAFVSVEVSDDGVGVSHVEHRSGLANLEQRAVRRDGFFRFTSTPGRTLLNWRVPYAHPEERDR